MSAHQNFNDQITNIDMHIKFIIKDETVSSKPLLITGQLKLHCLGLI